jgi:hypothetical protein
LSGNSDATGFAKEFGVAEQLSVEVFGEPRQKPDASVMAVVLILWAGISQAHNQF